MKKVMISLVLFGIASVLIVWALLDALPRTVVLETVDTSGHEEPQEGAVFNNGWIVANYGDIAIMNAYLLYQPFLGEPISGFDGQCQSFRLGRLCYRPGNPSDWQIEFANLGMIDMQVEGYTPKLGSTLHPAVRDWLIAQLEAGVDTTRVVGKVISEPICDAKTGLCRQWTDKQLFTFDRNALTGDQVQRAPLGLWLTHTRTRPTVVDSEKPDSRPDILPLLAGIAVLLAAVASLLRRGGSAVSYPV